MEDGSFQNFSSFGSGGGFEGARRGSSNRGYVVFPNLDTRKEINHSNRTEIMRKSRWLYDNNGLARRIIRGLARQLGYLSPKPTTPDRKWNSLAKKYFQLKTGTPQAFDASGKYGFNSYQLNLARLWLKDGDSLTVFAEGKDGSPQIKCFEGHQVGDMLKDRFNQFRKAKNRERARVWLDGALVGKDNEHHAYRIIHPDDPKRGSTVSAKVAHLYTLWERPGQPRGIGALHHAVNHMLDTAEILSDVKLGIKNSNQIGFYLKGREGAVKVGNKGIARDLRKQNVSRADDPTTTGDESSTDEGLPVEDVFGGSHIYQNADWEPHVLADPRPHPNNIDLLRWLVREVCLGLDFPPELIWEIGSLNGNTSRILNEDAQESLDSHRMELNLPFCQRTWFNVIGRGIALGELPEPVIPEDMEGLVGFWSVDWSAPPRKTIDRGREGRLNMEERSRMMRTLDRHFTETYQTDWTDETNQFLDEIETVLDMAEERDWPEERIRMLEKMLLNPPAGAANAEKPAEKTKKSDKKKNSVEKP
ncbi:MAG: phage portal protein [Alphaproteobacteria bacterium]